MALKLNQLDPKLAQRITKQINHEDNARRQKSGACAVAKEQQDAGPGKVNNRPKKAKVDEAMHPKFRVSVVLAVSDNRRRDADNALTTILDCLVAARRQLAEHFRVSYPGDKSSKG